MNRLAFQLVPVIVWAGLCSWLALLGGLPPMGLVYLVIIGLAVWLLLTDSLLAAADATMGVEPKPLTRADLRRLRKPIAYARRYVPQWLRWLAVATCTVTAPLLLLWRPPKSLSTAHNEQIENTKQAQLERLNVEATERTRDKIIGK